MVDVELFPLRPDDAQLGFLDGEPRIDKQDLVFSRHALCGNDECPERGSHRTGRRNASPWRDVYIDKSLHETRSLALQFGNPVGCGILRPHSTVQSGLLRFYTDTIGRQTRRALIHSDEWNPRLLFQPGSHQQHLADGGMGEVGNLQLLYYRFHQLFTKHLMSHIRLL